MSIEGLTAPIHVLALHSPSLTPERLRAYFNTLNPRRHPNSLIDITQHDTALIQLVHSKVSLKVVRLLIRTAKNVIRISNEASQAAALPSPPVTPVKRIFQQQAAASPVLQALVSPRPVHTLSRPEVKKCTLHQYGLHRAVPPSNGFTAILVTVDRLSKEGIFIPTTDNATSIDVAEAFVTQVFSKHGIPLHVSFDRGSEFTFPFLSFIRLPPSSGFRASASAP